MKNRLISCFFLTLLTLATPAFAYIYPFETALVKYLQPIRTTESQSNLDGIDCIYVINLDERTERWKTIKQACDLRNINVNRISAFNGWKLSKDNQDELMGPYLVRSGFLGGGRMGCLLSHVSIFKDAYEKGYNRIWILEDDAEFLGDVHQLSSLVKELSTLDPNWDALFTDLDWRDDQGHYVVAHGIDPRPNQPLKPLSFYVEKTQINPHFFQIHERYGTHSIIWSKHGLKKALDYFTHVYLWTSIDIDLHYIPEIREYCTSKDIVTNMKNHATSDTIFESSLNPENLQK
jgi:GR25 family glycosyltransferase involved in LPS biosynthesis